MPLPTMDYQSSRPRRIWSWRDLFFLRVLLTPLMVQLLFWVGLALILFNAAFAIYAAYSSPFLYFTPGGSTSLSSWSVNLPALISACATLLLGPILLRIACELLLLIFRILQRHADKDQTSGSSA